MLLIVAFYTAEEEEEEAFFKVIRIPTRPVKIPNGIYNKLVLACWYSGEWVPYLRLRIFVYNNGGQIYTNALPIRAPVKPTTNPISLAITLKKVVIVNKHTTNRA